ncbi:MAG TPA: DUF4395 domain-containing protein [Jatrophihabitans sp.]|nr:DUF4395 domain-containing protein [Jatrophihabitans sp.]
MKRRPYGLVLDAPTADGRTFRTGVFNETQVRAAAGITMALGAYAFVYANFAKYFLPIKLVTTFFFIDFLLRVTLGLHRSPVGVISHWLTRRRPPDWVSAQPKRFAWTLGGIMSGAMTVITNVNIHGVLPRTICLICLTLMWLESVLGLCLGCETYALLVRKGWWAQSEAYEVCAGGVCEVPGESVLSVPEVVEPEALSPGVSLAETSAVELVD